MHWFDQLFPDNKNALVRILGLESSPSLEDLRLMNRALGQWENRSFGISLSVDQSNELFIDFGHATSPERIAEVNRYVLKIRVGLLWRAPNYALHFLSYGRSFKQAYPGAIMRAIGIEQFELFLPHILALERSSDLDRELANYDSRATLEQIVGRHLSELFAMYVAERRFSDADELLEIRRARRLLDGRAIADFFRHQNRVDDGLRFIAETIGELAEPGEFSRPLTELERAKGGKPYRPREMKKSAPPLGDLIRYTGPAGTK